MNIHEINTDERHAINTHEEFVPAIVVGIAGCNKCGPGCLMKGVKLPEIEDYWGITDSRYGPFGRVNGQGRHSIRDGTTVPGDCPAELVPPVLPQVII